MDRGLIAGIGVIVLLGLIFGSFGYWLGYMNGFDAGYKEKTREIKRWF